MRIIKMCWFCQLGRKFVPSREPIEMRVVEKAKQANCVGCRRGDETQINSPRPGLK
jgi:hypothetical protein